MRVFSGPFTAYLALLAACSGGGGSGPPAPTVTASQLAGRYRGTLLSDGAEIDAWLVVDSDEDNLGQRRAAIAVAPGAAPFAGLPQSVDGVSVGGYVTLGENQVARFDTEGAFCVWEFRGNAFLRPSPTGQAAPSGPGFLDLVFPQRLSALATSLDFEAAMPHAAVRRFGNLLLVIQSPPRLTILDR